MAARSPVAALTTPAAPGIRGFRVPPDVVLPILMVLVVAMMIVPMPWPLMDVLLTCNVAGSLLLMMISLYVLEPVEFSTFPTLLLLLTLFRLALNVSTTRNILLSGEPGRVVEAFGRFVVGGNYAVGIVIFALLSIIQFIVITNGAGRISEVAARFTLDAMPGKQMAIDADLNSGLINEQEAKTRRKGLQREADFYGTMDGASKFVRGDAIATIIIVLINIVGGLIIGIVQRHLDVVQALQTYTILTIGDGLVSQIPALLISTGTGVLVSRAAASDDNLSTTIGRQLVANPKPLIIVAGMLIALGVVPGLPHLPFLMVGGALAASGYSLTRIKLREAALAEGAVAGEAAAPKGPENVMGLLKVDPMELEIGYRLIPLVDASQGGDLLERVTMIRRQTALKLGLVLPPIRIRDNLQLKPKEYRINLRGVEIAKSEVHIDHYMAMNAGLAMEAIDGIPTTEPVFGLPAVWITADQKERAEILGYTVFDASSVIATHLTEVIKAHAPEILSRQDVQTLLDHVKQDAPQVVAELVPDLLNLGDVQKVLQNLLKDRVSIRDLLPILESLATHGRLTKDLDTLTEYARLSIARAICKASLAPDGSLPVMTLDPQLEGHLAASIQQTDQGAFLSLEPGMTQKIVAAVAAMHEKQLAQGHQPVVLTSSKVRLVFRRLIERKFPNLAVMSYNEVVPPQTEVHSLGVIAT